MLSITAIVGVLALLWAIFLLIGVWSVSGKAEHTNKLLMQLIEKDKENERFPT